MAEKFQIKKEIIAALRGNQRGLTIQELCRRSKVSRPTMTKYVDKLLDEKRIKQRRVGAYRILYLGNKRR